MRLQIKAKNRFKPESVITRLFTERTNGDLDQDDWEAIIEYMYKEHDTATLSRTVEAFIEEKKKNIEF